MSLSELLISWNAARLKEKHDGVLTLTKPHFFSIEEIISANAGDVYAWELVSLKVGKGDAIANSSTDTLREWIHDVGWTCIEFIH